MSSTAIRVVVAALVCCLTACGSAAEQLVEGLAETGEGVQDVDVDLAEGEVRVQTDEGTLSFGTGQLPDGLPFDPPAGGRVLSSIEAGDSIGVTLEYELGAFDSLVAAVRDSVGRLDGDYEFVENVFELNDDESQRSAQWQGRDWFFLVVSCISADQPDVDGLFNASCLTMSRTD